MTNKDGNPKPKEDNSLSLQERDYSNNKTIITIINDSETL